jgi:hypothetical protein
VRDQQHRRRNRADCVGDISGVNGDPEVRPDLGDSVTEAGKRGGVATW